MRGAELRAGIKRGTQTLGIPDVVPGAIVLEDKPVIGVANAGRGTVIVPPTIQRKESQSWAVTDVGVTSNNGGAGISVLDVSTVNSAFQGLAYTFPNDGATDDNSLTIDIALPTFMSTTPNIKIRLFVLATGTGAC